MKIYEIRENKKMFPIEPYDDRCFFQDKDKAIDFIFSKDRYATFFFRNTNETETKEHLSQILQNGDFESVRVEELPWEEGSFMSFTACKPRKYYLHIIELSTED